MGGKRANSLLVSRRASINWIVMIYFVSGACSLIDEVVWVRLLKLTLGNTVYATSVVVSIFMAGLALGALIMGRFCDRVRRHLRLYALLESLVTVSAVSLPWALKLTDRVYVWLYRWHNLDGWELLVVQVILSAAVLLVPSMLMGSTLPLLGRFVTALEKQVGHLVGRLYAINTLGAAVGCLLAGFVLIREFGVMGTLYIAAILNMLVAFGGWFLSRYTAYDSAEASPRVKKQATASAGGKATRLGFTLLVVALFSSGLISIGYELLWMRSVVHLLGGYTYVFSAVLTVYLVGNVIGAAVSSRLGKRRNIGATGFAVTLGLLGLCGIIYLPVLVFWMSKLSLNVESKFTWLQQISTGASFAAGPLIHCLALFIVPSIVMGMGFPMALQAWANHVHKVGRSTGTAYGANTIGAVCGGIITGFILIPLLGVHTSFIVLALIGVWIGAALYFSFYGGAGIVRRFIMPGVAAVLTVLAFVLPPDLFASVVKINPGLPDWNVLRVQEGVTTTVSVRYIPSEDCLQLFSSGQSIAGDTFSERGDQKLLGHFGILLNNGAREALSVGFGSGETTACLAQHKLDKVDCVEIAPEVVDVALEHFTHINLGDRLDEEVNMIFMDAKNYVHLTDTAYDVIVNDSIHPRDFAENASLYGKEYFQGAMERLNEGGIIMSWMPIYHMPASVFVSVIGTLMEVCPNVTIWHPVVHPAPLVLLVGSKQRQSFSPEHIERELQKPGVQKSLGEIGFTDSVDVLSCYVGDQTDLRKVIGEFKINSDYTPFVEFTTDQETPPRRIFKRFLIPTQSDSIYEYIDWTNFDDEQKDEWLGRYKRAGKACEYLFKAVAATDSLDALKHAVAGLKILPDHPGLLNMREMVSQVLYERGIKLIASGRAYEAQKLTQQMLKIARDLAWAWIVRVNILVGEGDLEGALGAARMAAKSDPNNYEAHFSLGFVLFRKGRHNEAISACQDMLRTAEASEHPNIIKFAQMMDMVAVVYSAAGRVDDAVDAAEKSLEYAVSSGLSKLVERAEDRLTSLKAAQRQQAE
ncbi:MAG: fused MFS/spermidine synthase [Planctomycetota bacterium]|jgi:spermidine synthase